MANENPNFIVTTLPEYVANNRAVLVKDVVFGTPTIRRIVPQTGIKTKGTINYISADPVLQDGKGCKFTPDNTTELTQREIETALIKVNESYCPDTLLGKWAEYLVRIRETQRESFPFEAYVLQVLTNAIQHKIEMLVWQGDKTLTSDNNLKWIDGFLKLAEAASVTEVEYQSTGSVIAAIQAVILALPADVIRRGDVRVFISPEKFLQFSLEVVQANLYHYAGPQNETPEEFVYPGTGIRVVSTEGLSGSDRILATNRDNLYYGTDVEDAERMFKVTYDDTDNVFNVAVRWNMGVQIAFPDRVVVGKPAE